MTLSAAQLEARSRGVGCSEVLAALGKDPRCTRLELYKRKLGEIAGPDFSKNERVRFGTLLEPVVRQEFARRTRFEVIEPEPDLTLFHATAPLLGHDDGFIPTEHAGVEIKCADKDEAQEFGAIETDQIPTRYYLQCAGYMALRDVPLWYLAVLVGGNDFRIYRVERDLELEAALLEGVRLFWQHVERRDPPPPETPADLVLRWPRHFQPTIRATDFIQTIVDEHAQAKLALDAWREREELLAAEIKRYMTDAGDLLAPDSDRILATWRAQQSRFVFNESDFMADHFDLYREFCDEVPGNRPFLNKVYRKAKAESNATD